MPKVRRPNEEWVKRFGEGHEEYLLKCPGGCGEHRVIVRWGASAGKAEPAWTFNGDLDRPTFHPSLLVRWQFTNAEHGFDESHVCHSFIRDGKILFLGDCTHKLAGQTVELPEVSG